MKEETTNDAVLAANIDRALFSRDKDLSDDEVERRVSESFGKLSVKERTEAMHDVHGVCDAIAETPRFVEEHLSALDEALRKIAAEQHQTRILSSSPTSSQHITAAFHLACSRFPDYVASRKFRLRMLRAERFDAKKAAERTVHYFDWKRKLFGGDLLGREIQLSDLKNGDRDDDALAILRRGDFRMLPHRDQAGRLIFFASKEFLERGWSLLQRHRLMWYILNLAAQDEMTQKKGIVGVWWMMGSMNQSHQEGRRNAASVSQMKSALPIHISVAHVCLSDPIMSKYVSFALLFQSRAKRVRVKAHGGTPQEVMYELMSFGIARKILPIDDEGVVQIDAQGYWIDSQQRIENQQEERERQHQSSSSLPLSMEQEEPSSRITNSHERGSSNVASVSAGGTIVVWNPTERDILLGRGSAIELSPGNLWFRKIIEVNFRQFEESPKYQKSVVIHSIYRQIQKRGGRFLKQVDASSSSSSVAAALGATASTMNEWQEVDSETARSKITNAFRNFAARGQAWGHRGRKISSPKEPEAATATSTAAASAPDRNNHFSVLDLSEAGFPDDDPLSVLYSTL